MLQFRRMANDIILLGLGGHSHHVIDIFGQHNIIGGYDDKQPLNSKMLYLGKLSDAFLLGKNTKLYCTIGDNIIRQNIVEQFKQLGFHNWPSCIHTTTNIGSSVQLGHGLYIGINTIITSSSSIGDFTICNDGVTITHNVEIGKYTHIAPGSVVLGNVKIGSNCLIGGGSIIKPNIVIPDNTIVGAGSVVTKNFETENDQLIIMGNPAHKK